MASKTPAAPSPDGLGGWKALVERSPAFLKRSPAFLKRSPAFLKRSPTFVKRSPTFVKRSPAFVDRSPAFVDRSPAFVKRSPAFVDRSPAFVDRSPAFVDRSPAFVKRSPAFVDRSPTSPTQPMRRRCRLCIDGHMHEHQQPAFSTGTLKIEGSKGVTPPRGVTRGWPLVAARAGHPPTKQAPPPSLMTNPSKRDAM
ncbi:hypothetical protein F8S13_20785 [Chloroflexia bacterium SDU3-3]|nr:hypothetical protein F8S13_20785 [Chloroflexia bacterium SDU3-3]